MASRFATTVHCCSKTERVSFEHELQHNARELYNMSVYKEMLKNVDTFMQKTIKPRPRPTSYEAFVQLRAAQALRSSGLQFRVDLQVGRVDFWHEERRQHLIGSLSLLIYRVKVIIFWRTPVANKCMQNFFVNNVLAPKTSRSRRPTSRLFAC